MSAVVILMPFFFALLLVLLRFVKNPQYTRRIAKIFSFIQFASYALILLCYQKESFSLFNINFVADKVALYLVFLTSFVFLLFSIMSKSFVFKLHRVFYAMGFLLLGLLNLAIFADNIFIFLITLFWIFLVNYFLSVSFSTKEAKKDIDVQLACDIGCIFLAIAFIIKDFARYFIINDIDFSFSNLIQNLYRIDDVAIVPAWFALLGLCARLFNFVPFSAKNLSISNKINPFIFSLNSITAYILGCYLFLRCYLNFDYLFYQYQDEIALFLLVNFVIFVLLVMRQKNLFRFLTSIGAINAIVVIFSVFSFEAHCSCNFVYYSIAYTVAYCLCAFVFAILKDKFKTDDVDEFRKISETTKTAGFFIVISLLNIVPVPFMALFGAQALSFMMIFSTDYEGIVLNIAPYCLFFGSIIVSLTVFGMIHKIIALPPSKDDIKIVLCNHQMLVCSLLAILSILIAFCARGLFSVFMF